MAADAIPPSLSVPDTSGTVATIKQKSFEAQGLSKGKWKKGNPLAANAKVYSERRPGAPDSVAEPQRSP